MRGPYRKRRIHQPPNFKNFKPSGIPRGRLKSLILTIDEYEAIRLADFLRLEHLQAAEKMAISRPTFTRLIEKARHKLARVIVDGLELIVEGGNIEFANTLYRCRDCGDERINPYSDDIKDCRECGSENLEDLAQNFIDDQSNPKIKENSKDMNGLRNSKNPGGGHGPDQGAGRGRNKGGAFGKGGFCVCAKCGEKIPHQQGIKCTTVKCPQCGHTMVREELLNKK